ncbi:MULTISPECIES: glycosyltransferase family 2 protein [Vibrio harveyi group]|nr:MULTISPECIES: glycosyltransferase [Vibrio harveyi group]MBE4307860.1 glycosyltransferase [Vibrio parahaemolyticus]MCG6308824.1 glycosyltransferase [Vibrio alginolyticus]PNM41695.1 glycosyltransferase family 2 protein [Vibrio harveyi]
MSIESPFVSIVMPCYNAAQSINQSIQSVLEQTYLNWELIIVDDFSSDNTPNIVSNIKDARVHFYQLDVNSGGPTTPRNFALEMCRGKYVSFLDADDLWEPDKLELQVAALETGYDIVCSNYTVFLADNVDEVLSNRKFPREFTYRNMLKRNCIGNLTGIYNREKLGLVLQKDHGHEDYIMWLELVKKVGKVYCVQKPLARYRITPNSISSDKSKAAKWQWEIYRRELGLSLIASSYYFLHYVINVIKRKLVSRI